MAYYLQEFIPSHAMVYNIDFMTYSWRQVIIISQKNLLKRTNLQCPLRKYRNPLWICEGKRSLLQHTHIWTVHHAVFLTVFPDLLRLTTKLLPKVKEELIGRRVCPLHAGLIEFCSLFWKETYLRSAPSFILISHRPFFLSAWPRAMSALT